LQIPVAGLVLVRPSPAEGGRWLYRIHARKHLGCARNSRRSSPARGSNVDAPSIFACCLNRLPMLELDAITAGYGGFRALAGVLLEVRPDEAVAVVGPKGANEAIQEAYLGV
jgi:ABC-type multidrug transport system fused ATPase/permease subunit